MHAYYRKETVYCTNIKTDAMKPNMRKLNRNPLRVNKYLLLGGLALIMTSCGGWGEDEEEKLHAKCKEHIYDCDCYVKTTVEFFESPDDYNDNSEGNEKYAEALEDCMKEVEGDGEEAAGWSVADEDFLWEKCNDQEYECNCYVNTTMDFFQTAKDFEEDGDNADYISALEDCRNE